MDKGHGMEVRQQFNSGQYEAARRAWVASTEQSDPRTQKALERLSVTYFFGACGMGGESATGVKATPSPFAGIAQRRA